MTREPCGPGVCRRRRQEASIPEVEVREVEPRAAGPKVESVPVQRPKRLAPEHLEHPDDRAQHLRMRSVAVLVMAPHRYEGIGDIGSLATQVDAHDVVEVFGQPDIFLFITTQDERSLSDVVITKIHQIEGVEETDTHIVADT